MAVNLKEFREKALKLSQKEFADKLKVTQNTISRWEAEPDILSIAKLEEIVDVFGYQLIDILQFNRTLSKQVPWGSKNQIWGFIKKDIVNLNEEIAITKRGMQNSQYKEFHAYQKYAKQRLSVLNGIKQIGHKPSVSFSGASDVGKSTMINTLLGDNTLAAKWMPTTSACTKIVHIDDKPRYMEGNNTAVFVTEDREGLINIEKLDDEKYFKDHLIEVGGRNLIDEFGTHDGDEFKKRYGTKDKFFTIVTYIDAPILEQCTIWDVPGLEASSKEELSDDYIANVAREGADVMIYLSVSNQFMHNFDMQYLKAAIDTIPRYDRLDSRIAPFENLFIIASQAHIVLNDSHNNDLKAVMDSRIDEFGKTLPNDYWEKISESPDGQKRDLYTLEDIKARTFTFERDRLALQKKFKEAFISLLDKLSYLTKEKLEKANNEFRKAYNDVLDSEIRVLVEFIENAERAKYEYEEFVKAKPQYKGRNKKIVAMIKENAQLYKVDSATKISELYDLTINVENVRNLIDEKGYGKKKVGKEQFVAWLQNNLNSKADEIIKANSERLANAINGQLNEFAKDNIMPDVSRFNYVATFIGGLSSIATVGAFALYFSTLGNLGGYIFLAKVVSVLSSIGISLGGTATVASTIAAIGGPMTLVVAIAVIVGAVIAKLVGGSWQKTFAKQIVKGFEKKYKPKETDDEALNGKTYKEILLYNSDKYWQDTYNAINVEMFNVQLDEEEQRFAEQARQSPDELKKSKAGLETLRFNTGNDI